MIVVERSSAPPAEPTGCSRAPRSCGPCSYSPCAPPLASRPQHSRIALPWSSGADLGQQAVDERLCLSRVPAAEEVGVVQHVVEVVELGAQRRARRQRRGALVSAIKGWAKATEKTGHGKIGLAVAVIDRGIEHHRFPRSAREPVSAPQIPVQERSARPVTGEQRRQSFEQPRAARAETPWKTPFLAEHQLRAQAPLAEELHPVRAPFIRLRG